MKYILATLFLGLSTILFAQQKNPFPGTWAGEWRGEVNWFKTGENTSTKVSMELKIQPTLKPDQWTWQIIYGGAGEDERPYTLKLVDSTKGHWVIDENNGIVLDQYFVAGKLCGMFTVGNSTILNNYWREGDNLVVEFFSVEAKPITATGSGTKDSPKVDSYRIGGYQKAILTRR